MEKIIRTNDMVLRLQNVFGLRTKMRNCWNKWKLEVEQRSNFNEERRRQIVSMINSSASIISRTIRKYNKRVKTECFKTLTINFVKSR